MLYGGVVLLSVLSHFHKCETDRCPPPKKINAGITEMSLSPECRATVQSHPFFTPSRALPSTRRRLGQPSGHHLPSWGCLHGTSSLSSWSYIIKHFLFITQNVYDVIGFFQVVTKPNRHSTLFLTMKLTYFYAEYFYCFISEKYLVLMLYLAAAISHIQNSLFQMTSGDWYLLPLQMGNK